ncbi:hypothetical protein [Dysosmobacter sp.]|uniref:hypothetical protein n=1 Tax=Dysosmobacter sp. TaxID=2591382 RepID=UPI002A8CD4B9|nr:hypothetical protein [Dysosmobacter sp.]MDY3282797.1 hypothetical protein [Dysosmobacter sp.]
MYSGIPYGAFYDDPYCRVSVDNVRMKFTYKYKGFDHDKREPVLAVDRCCSHLERLFYRGYEVAFSSAEFRIGKYEHTCTIKGLDWSCAVMVGRYTYDSSCRQTAPEAVFDFNPNKVPRDCIDVVVQILSEGCVKREIVRYDVAFDFPVSREEVTLIRNSRQCYRQFWDASKGLTEYQGERSAHNAMKLYDKTKECGLSVPVTRCEITVGGDYKRSLRDLFPSLNVFAGVQLDVDAVSLPFQVLACIKHPDLIPALKASCSSNTWRKYHDLIDSCGNSALSPDDWKAVDRFVSATLRELERGGL